MVAGAMYSFGSAEGCIHEAERFEHVMVQKAELLCQKDL